MIKFPQIPLAERIRPVTLEDFQGQHQIVGDEMPLKKMIENDDLSSVIFWGPPGSGKTTLANIIAAKSKAEFFKLNAVSSGVKDVRSVIEIAKENLNYNRKTILFIDEIHRFNKAQQDALLHSVENGEIILIGATTENPSFEVIPALRSRVRIYILEELGKKELNAILDYAIKKDKWINKLNIKDIDRDFLFYISGGDARSMLTIFETCLKHEVEKKEIVISKDLIEKIVQRKNIAFDKGGEEHYNVISAFIKSIRGSDPDAALYWLARMIEGGEDPLFIARRLIIAASEDIGNASPNALLLAEATFNAVDKIGMPEGRIILSQCTTYLASCPKSNAAYVAIKKAQEDVRQRPVYPVPLHLRNAPTKLMKEIGYGNGYKYPHDFQGNFITENYFPDEMKGTQYYFPTENGLEKSIKERLKVFWKKLKKY